MNNYFNPYWNPYFNPPYYNYSSPPPLPSSYNRPPGRQLNFCEQCGCIMGIRCTIMNGLHGIMVNGKFYTTVKEILGETCYIDPRPIFEEQSSPVIYYPTMGIFEKLLKLNLTIKADREILFQTVKLFNRKYFRNGNVANGMGIFIEENTCTEF